MTKTISRREFLKYAGLAGGGMAVIVVSSKLSWLTQNQAYAATQTLSFTIGDAVKNMHTHNSINSAQCYFWIYKSTSPNLPPECPGPTIVAAHGDTIVINVTNSLDEPHTLSCPSLGVNSAAIAPGATVQISIPASICGSHLYYDNLNAPVNRVMGLHGAIIVMPVEADRTAGHNLTPYGGLAADHAIQKLYDDFGRNTQTGAPSDCFPGLAWEEGDNTPWALNGAYPGSHLGVLNRPNCPPFRQYVWLTHQASPKLFAEVGDFTAGQDYPAQQFLDRFLRGPFAVNNSGIVPQAQQSYIPQYFTINGQSGYFSHFSPQTTMMGRVGEPCVTHILNAGLWTHSMHLHANHMWITSVNGEVNPNPIWVDVFRVDPLDRIDYTVPFMRPPSIPNTRGIGLPDEPRRGGRGLTPLPVWPPAEEMNVYIPPLGTKAKNAQNQDVELGQRLSPLCYPMHDHSEPSQTSQGGNYNTGLISGIYFTGDRNTPGFMDFPMDEDFWMGYQNIRGVAVTQPAAPPLGAHNP